MSDTPETDAAEVDISSDALTVHTKFVQADFARRLERQRNQLRSKIMKWRDMRPQEMRLIMGELTSDEIRSIKAVLHQIAPLEL